MINDVILLIILCTLILLMVIFYPKVNTLGNLTGHSIIKKTTKGNVLIVEYEMPNGDLKTREATEEDIKILKRNNYL